MKRRLINFLTLLSLLLCVATVALCVRSYVATDHVTYARYRVRDDGATSYRRIDARTGRGSAVIFFRWSGNPVRPNYPPDVVGWRHATAPPEKASAPHVQRWGFGCHWYRGPVPAAGLWYWEGNVAFPLYVPAALLVVPALIWQLARVRRTRRAAAGRLCAACGYDLRATPERCPECGTVP